MDRVFLTHLHSDHVVGLPDLWLSGWLYRQHRPLHIHGPARTVQLSGHLAKAFKFDVQVCRDTGVRLPGGGATIVTQDIDEGPVLRDRDLLVTAILVDHSLVEPAFAYRIDYAGRSVVISGDTRPSDNLVKAAVGVDVLIHEVIAVDDALAATERIRSIVEHHTTARQAGRVFERSRPRLAVFSHIVLVGDVDIAELEARARESYDGPCGLARTSTSSTSAAIPASCAMARARPPQICSFANRDCAGSMSAVSREGEEPPSIIESSVTSATAAKEPPPSGHDRAGSCTDPAPA